MANRRSKRSVPKRGVRLAVAGEVRALTSQTRASMLVIANNDDYIEEMLVALRA